MGQSEWPQYFPDCGGTSQSPVDVATTQTKYDPSLIPLTPLGYSQHGNRPFTLYNNGHTGKYIAAEFLAPNVTVSRESASWLICLYCTILKQNPAVNFLLFLNYFRRLVK